MESYEELTGYSDEQLIEIFNADRQNVVVGKQRAWLTVLIAALTAVGAVASVIAALRSG